VQSSYESNSDDSSLGNGNTTAILEHLKNHRFARFSCHREPETAKPLGACFKLYQGTCLTLLGIVWSRLQVPNVEFVFLSTGHTAELTGKSPADEEHHLTGPIQYCGFRSAIGTNRTMWATADVDGLYPAGNLYSSVFPDRWGGVSYCEGTTVSLWDAVKSLQRKKNMNIERWVNFVHYGI